MAVLKIPFCGEVINDFSTVWGSLNSVLHVSSVRTCKHLVSGPEREQQHWFITVANNGGLCGGRLQPEGPTVGLQTRASLFSAAAERAAQRSASGQWLFLKGPHMQKEPGSTGDRESSSHPGAGGGLIPDGIRTSQDWPFPPWDTALLRVPALLTALVFLILSLSSLLLSPFLLFISFFTFSVALLW